MNHSFTFRESCIPSIINPDFEKSWALNGATDQIQVLGI